MADHYDLSYKLLFAHPQIVRDLLEGFVGGSWLSRLDFATLERVSSNYVSDKLQHRSGDIVWRVRCGEHHVYLLIEFQSGNDRLMALRVLTYVGLPGPHQGQRDHAERTPARALADRSV
jgi:predicted transposase YdaD